MDAVIAAAIGIAHDLYFSHLSRQSALAAEHFAVCVAAGTASGAFVDIDRRLPRTLGVGQIAEYIAIAYPALARNRAALKRSIKAASADGSIAFAYRASMSVQYGNGSGTASGFIATRPIGYDRFNLESVDAWASSQVAARLAA